MQYWRKITIIKGDSEGQAGRNMVKRGSFWQLCNQKGWDDVEGGGKGDDEKVGGKGRR